MGDDAVAGVVEPVLAAPGPQDHLRVIEEVAIDRDRGAVDGKWLGLEPGGVGVACRFACAAPLQEHDVRHDAGPFPLKSVRRQPNGAEEIGALGEVLADGGVLLVEREVAGDKREDTAGFQRIDGLRKEEVVERQAKAAMLELDVGKRHVPDHGVDAALGEQRVAKVLDADIVAGVKRASDPPGEGIEFDADKAHALWGEGHEFPGAAAGLEDRGLAWDTEAAQGLVHGADDGGRRIEGVKRGALGALVLLGRKQHVECLAQDLPGGVFVGAGHGVGKEREGDGPETPKAHECLPLVGRRRPPFVLEVLERPNGVEEVFGLRLLAARERGM